MSHVYQVNEDVHKIAELGKSLCALFFFSNFSSISVLRRDPRYPPVGPPRAVTQLRLRASKNADSASEILHLSHKMQTAAFHSLHPFTPPLIPSSHTEPPLAPLSCRCAWLTCDEDTLRGVGRDEGDPFYLFSWNPPPDPEWSPVFPIVRLMSLPGFPLFAVNTWQVLPLPLISHLVWCN